MPLTIAMPQRRQRALKIKQEASTVRSAHPANSLSNEDNCNNMTNRALITENEATNSLMSDPAVTLRGDGGTTSDKGSLGHASGDQEQTSISEQQRKRSETNRQAALAKKAGKQKVESVNDIIVDEPRSENTLRAQGREVHDGCGEHRLHMRSKV